MKRIAVLCLAALTLSAQTSDKTLAGFTADHAKREFELEAKFDQSLNRQNLGEWLKRMSARPHHIGSPAGREVAEFIAAQFKSWGFETTIETFYPLFPTPKTRLVEMTDPTPFKAKLVETGVEGGLPVYHAYSADGDVTAPLVYVNYGVPADYERLAEMGIDVKGKIVLARYGASWRGIKPKVAAEHGAVGCIIYSDPHEDGYFMGDVWPKGGWRPPEGAQRGSVMDLPTYPGDPLTPDVGATKDAKRPASFKDAQTLTKIPVLPISYGDAEPMLRALGGPVAPLAWRGALPLTYHIGPGPATVHLKLEFNWNLAPAHNVIAKLKGSDRADEWIIRGNHHDAWVYGASDPLTGMVALMEEARGVAELAKSGWRPRRTMIYCAWDGEEPALLGSTEWAEYHAAELRQHAAVYVNTDSTSAGFIHIGGSHTLEYFAGQAARDLVDPQTHIPARERAASARSVASGRPVSDWSIGPLGSGSDYTPFLQHLGIASLNIGFGGFGSGGGSYHSDYDNYEHVVKFEDPDSQYMLATSQLGGRIMLRLANADVLPWRFDNFSRTVSRYSAEVQKLIEDMRTQTQARNELIRSKAFDFAADPSKTSLPPQPKEPVPYLNFAPLQNAIARLEVSTTAFQKRDPSRLSDADARKLDEILIQTERTLTRPEGLPRRPWYRHQIYAPGYYTGYGVKTLPAIREAIEERNWAEANEGIAKVAQTLDAFSREIDRAGALFGN